MQSFSSFAIVILILQTPLYLEAYYYQKVVDIDGDELQAGIEYYILPAAFRMGTTSGGGLSLGSRNGTYPIDVTQRNGSGERGRPARFTPAPSSSRHEIIRQVYTQSWATGEPYREQTLPYNVTIRESTDLNVQFSGTATVWQLREEEERSGRRYVTVGGEVGRPGLSTLNNWFMIERVGSFGYKLVYCPDVCKTCTPDCGDIGTIDDENGRRWLLLADNPLWVVFEKADMIMRS